MRNRLISSCVLVLALIISGGAQAARADACVSGSIQQYVALGSTGCTIGSYLFHDINYSGVANGGVVLPDVIVNPVLNDIILRDGVEETGLSLLADWVVNGGQTINYQLSVSITSLSQLGILAGLAGYGGSPYPATALGENQIGLTSYLFSDSNGYTVTGSNLFTNVVCNPCMSFGGGANFITAPQIPPIHPELLPQTITMSYDMEFSAAPGGFVQVGEQFTGIEDSPTYHAVVPELSGLTLLGTGVLVLLGFLHGRTKKIAPSTFVLF